MLNSLDQHGRGQQGEKTWSTEVQVIETNAMLWTPFTVKSTKFLILFTPTWCLANLPMV